MLKDLMISEDELRTQLQADLRWDKYATAQANEKVLLVCPFSSKQ